MPTKHCFAAMLLTGTLGGSTLFPQALPGQTVRPAASPILAVSATKPQPAGPGNLSAAKAGGWHARQGEYYKRTWGVDIVDVREVASGEMLAFRYLVLDPEKAKVLNDKRSSAYLIDRKTGARLQVPQMEKIGALRTTVTPKSGRMYWIVFANTGHMVKEDSHVDVVVGDFHAQNLVVDIKR